MMSFLSTVFGYVGFGSIANLLGISRLRLIIYVVAVVAVVTGALVIRQHYVNVGWYSHKAAVERQDNIAISASREVEKKADACSEANGFWDVITQGCKMQEEETVK